MWQEVLRALWLFLPAYVANMSPVFSAKLLPRWNAPIDGGRLGKDDLPILGPGKTWRGLVAGAVAGALTALILAIFAPIDGGGVFGGYDFGLRGYAGGAIGSDPGCPDTNKCLYPASPWWAVLLFGAVVGGMALVGDAVKSYFKRRRGKARGASWVPFDQLDFVVFGLLGVVIASPLLVSGWVWAAYFGHWLIPVTLLVLTPLLHWLVNVIGYWLRLKEVPW